ncbi:MAG TPA: ABC transporter permease subunit [Terriglobales bacterium]|nr:ABC transporter permease subunit [Terriglobales bacterium]
MKRLKRVTRRGTRLLKGGPWSLLPLRTWPHLIDVVIFAAGLALFYALVTVARSWLGPVSPSVQIDRSPFALPAYAGYSLLRIFIAYLLSLVFTIAYGYAAAYNATAERFMIPLLDILQSIPVLSFLPGVMLAMVALFPQRQLGVEFGAILLIFTGQVWNMAFSFYASLKGIPKDMQEIARAYRFNPWLRFRDVEMPSAAIGLVWNSMMSVAGGWFFLMACEMFVLGNRDFRLPGLGSYLQTAASAGDTEAILWGVTAMVALIILLDQMVWRPIITWAEKFKLEQIESGESPRSWFLDLLRRSRLISRFRKKAIARLFEALSQRFAGSRAIVPTGHDRLRWTKKWIPRIVGVLAIAAICYAIAHVALMLAGLNRADVVDLGTGLLATFIRVNFALLIGAAWTIPAGVAIGFSPRLSRIAQPLAQIAASVPATALFPIVLLVLIRLGGGLGIASVVLLLLGTQWYILFNVIAGAIAIPADLKEAAAVFKFGSSARWRKLILPGIFPYLITGLVTASGGAWNASIIAEYFHFKGQIFSTVGLGAVISRATDSGNFDLLIASTVVMAAVVVIINRMVWRKLYLVAETRYKLES